MYNPLLSFLCSVFGIGNVSDITSLKHFSEIKYFHPNGESMKDGIYVYKGFFLGECVKNSRSFCLFSPYFKVNFYKKGRCKVGVILFPEGIDMSVTELTRQINSYFPKTRSILTSQHDLKFEVNENFFGSYISPSGFKFGNRSLTIEVCGIRHKELLRLTDRLYQELKPGCVVVRDFNRNKFYYKEL